MAWIIVDSSGHPLTDNEGTMILVDTREAAREWLMRDDQRIERFEAWVEGSSSDLLSWTPDLRSYQSVKRDS